MFELTVLTTKRMNYKDTWDLPFSCLPGCWNHDLERQTCFYIYQEHWGLKWEIQTHLFTKIHLFAHTVLNALPLSIISILSLCIKVEAFSEFL